MTDKILFVDDDVRVVNAIQRGLHAKFAVDTAGSPKEALDIIMERSYAVVVSDLNMPGMNGIDFLREAKFLAPQAIGVLLTGQADLESAISAVNDGHIFRFLRKPCPPELLVTTLDAALGQYSLVCTEKVLLQETLVTTVSLLIELLGSAVPLPFGRAQPTRKIACAIARDMNLKNIWELDAASLLSHVGCLSVSAETLRKYYAGVQLTDMEIGELDQHPRIGRELLRRVPRLSTVAEIIGRQKEEFRCISSDGAEALKVTLYGQILRAAHEFDRLLGLGLSVDESLKQMEVVRSNYNPHILNSLRRVTSTKSGAESNMAS